ncbi:NADH-quinone oxidoreductase subunit N [Aliifodinibius sp. S!AR15-10]|uniref:NADH-quinone oxidoreductase subunit N n=1 Tax=Aliifodinibius sp. S!AR15-10 TaxID=2950437 RepID=UPI0028578359|nr:NADH-quinone oxidoreductase subunit N [Aliifodinibius sp. S!AR15-10]MDR8390567.1 NADH-quinone oxidoreductase subunit N [Aliifodinibius sp. S!AR15-10]
MDYLQNLSVFLPGVIVALAGLIAVLIDAYKNDHEAIFGLSVVSLVAALVVSIMDLFGPMGEAFSGMIIYGGTAAFGNMIVLLGTLFCVLISKEYLEAVDHNFGEVYALVLFATTGMLALASSNDLIMVFIGLETMSICLYILAGIINEEKIGAEASLKYFLLGAFSTGFLLYGMALLYGATGTTSLPGIAAAASSDLLFVAGAGLLLVGFFFKISAVPFHMWTPDVYQGTPTTLTAYFATASKSATFVALILILSRMLPDSTANWAELISVIAIITMILGNIIALVQDNMKRMLAYSSIAHAGYLMVGLAAGTAEGYSAVLYYLLAYTLMNVGAFGVVAFYERQKGLDFTDINNYAGLGFKRPAMGVMLSIFLFSLAGIPPFVGFVGKYQVFAAAVNADFIGLAIVGVLASAASVYYYLRPMVYLYMREPHKDVPLVQPGWLFKGSLILLAVLTLYFGIAPGGVSDLLNSYYAEGWASLMP